MAVAAGIIVLGSWWAGFPSLVTIVPGTVTMKPNTALCFALLGLSLWALGPRQPIGSLRQVVGLVAALAAGVLGLLTLAEWLFHWNLHLDQALFNEAAGATGTTVPGRMAATTALCFVLGGLSLSQLHSRHVLPSQLMAGAMGLVGFMALAGFCLDVESLRGAVDQTQMAVLTSVTFCILSAGILTARPTGVMAVVHSHGVGGRAARLLLPAALFVPLFLGALTLWGERLGLYGNERGLSVLAAEDTIVFALIIWEAARELDAAEAAEKEVEGALVQSQKLESIGRLSSGIAHDFNNMLTAIMGYAGLAQHELTERGPGREYIDEVMAAAGRASDLTRQLLSFARKQAVQPQVFRPNDELEGIISLLGRLVGDDIALVLKPDPEAGPIALDLLHFEQILMNLAVNARDAMPNGGKITIATDNMAVRNARQSEEVGLGRGEYVRITVTDRGTGIDDDVKPHIFEPFFTTKEQGIGTGLGLSTCLRIVQEAGGTITVDSTPGGGASFAVCLPRVAADVAAVVRPTPAQPPKPVIRPSETVLVVEDERGLRSLMVRALELEGYRVFSAGNGRRALRQIVRLGSDLRLLVADVVLPGVSGVQLAGQVRHEYPSVRLLLTSGLDNPRLDGFPFLAKPFTIEQLTMKVRQALDEPLTGATASGPSERSGGWGGTPYPGLLRTLPPVCQDIVTSLLGGREATVEEIAATLRISPMVVRKNLVNLSEAGLLNSRFARSGPGRPARMFGLSPHARGLFPTAYSSVASDLVRIAVGLGKAEEAEVAEILSKRQRADLLASVQAQDFDGRMELLTDHLRLHGCVLEATDRTSDSYLLTILSCPLVDLAERFPALCESEIHTFSKALAPCRIRQLESLRGGGSACAFSIRSMSTADAGRPSI